MLNNFKLCSILTLSLLLLFSCSLKKKKDKELASGSQTKKELKGKGAVGSDENAFGKEESSITEGDVNSGNAENGNIGASDENLSKIYFDFDSFTLNDESKDILTKNSTIIKKRDMTVIRIVGHADERGSSSYNLALGQQRANSIKKYLTDLGVKSEALKIESMGEEQPSAPGSSEEAYAQNRRGEFEIHIIMEDENTKGM